eukprot:TRINITY_DN127720_c0_g1_i2.p1 TRINITY_DN127720_c0_g1~~TRINITY_DN127720_c0_g1_i2.p1  ORF type:complete len:809 (-),score=292.24 TRINITY_DN127720_c0_g1_i2:418-2844(-)
MSGKSAEVGKHFEQLIPLVNKLQDAFSVIGYQSMDLPQIAVIGGQSSGKSSVLENVVGKSFLPRGSGIVTRRPLVLQLVNNPEGKEYGVFLHAPDKKIYDFDKIREEIDADTERECGDCKGLSDKPINLKIYSPHVLNLTLIDLPGTTKIAVGDQPVDIGDQIKQMMLDFIEKPNCILLAVTAANTDLANSDALEMARKVDPKGDRTVGVLTKLDLMDEGTDAMDILEGQVFPLKLGYIPVVNRSQKDINDNKSIDDARNKEMEYFRRHTSYRRIQSDCGTQFLCKKLTRILVNKIQSELPTMFSQVNSLLQQKRDELKKMGDATDPNAKRKILSQAIVSFSGCLTETIDGSSVDDTEEMRGGAKIEYIFREVLGPALAANGMMDLTAENITTMINNVSGLGGGLFIPDKAFSLIIKASIRNMQKPCLDCVQMVYDELVTIVSCITTKELESFPILRDQIISVSTAFLSKLLEPLKNLVNTLIEMELSRMNLNHPDFIGRDGGIAKVTQIVQNEMEKFETAKEKEREAKKAEERRAQGVPEPQQIPQNDEMDMERMKIMGVVSQKKSGMFGNWSERFGVAEGRTCILRLYKSQDMHHEVAMIPLKGVMVMDVSALVGRPRTFRIANPTDKKMDIELTVESNDEFKTWVENLQKFAGSSKHRMSVRAVPIVLPKTGPIQAGRKPAPEPLKDPLANLKKIEGFGKRTLTRRDMIEAEILRRLLTSYFNIVKKTILDQIPKAISLKLIENAKEELPSELMTVVYTNENIDELMSESTELVEKREKTKSMVLLLEEAFHAMSKIRVQTATVN